jgi:hypothetical protein
MNNFNVEQSGGSISLIDADKKTIRNESAIVIILGLFYFFLGLRIRENQIAVIGLIISLLYISTGILGCLSLRSNNSFLLKLYKILIYVLIVIKVLCIIFLLFLIGYIILNPVDCSKSKSDTCGLGQALMYIILILAVIGIIIYCATLFLFCVMLNHSRKYLEDIQSMRFVHFT